MSILIHDEPLDSPVATELITQLNRELERRYPEPGANHFRLDASEVVAARGAFLIAREAGVALGCGAYREIEPGVAEVKRMYVSPAARGRGVGTALLAALESRARLHGATRFVLETGQRQREAVALYERAGYRRVAAFGEYVTSPLSLCMAKTAPPRG